MLLSGILYIIIFAAAFAACDTSWAADSRTCFDQKTSERMVVSLERGQIAEEEVIPAYREALERYKETVKEYDELVKIMSTRQTVDEKAIQDLNDRLQKFGVECNQAIEAAKPGFWTYFGSGFVGALIGAAVMFLVL